LENWCRKNQHSFGPEGGQALAEFAFAFPLQLLIMFAIMQLALIYVAKQVVTYASYSAARSAMVADTPEDAYKRAQRAAHLVCSPITGPTVEGAGMTVYQSRPYMIEMPGWGYVPKCGIAWGLKTHASTPVFSPDGEVTVSVMHHYELIFPVVGHAFAWLAGQPGGVWPHDKAWDAIGGGGTPPRGTRGALWKIRAPHIRLMATTTLAIPGSEAQVLRRRGVF